LYRRASRSNKLRSSLNNQEQCVADFENINTFENSTQIKPNIENKDQYKTFILKKYRATSGQTDLFWNKSIIDKS